MARLLGRGGMGAVYDVEDQERGVRVALKTLPEVTGTSLFLFKNEFRALSNIIHPNLVALYELMSAGDLWFFTMELVEGVHLLEYVRYGGPAPESEAVGALTNSTTLTAVVPQTENRPSVSGAELRSPEQFERMRKCLTQVVDGLTVLHRAGKLHRDIKPSNILVDRNGRVVILDFGLVSNLGYESMHARLAGTPAYMSPEQLRGQTLTEASDWYSVGTMVYELLTGRLPYSNEPGSEGSVRDKLRSEPLRSNRLTPQCPRDLRALCLDLLRLRPDQRPDARMIAEVLGASGEPAEYWERTTGRFTGRKREMERLNGAFEAMREGRTVAAFVHGPSGIGKTALLDSFAARLSETDGVLLLYGRCYEQESVPYKAIDSLIDNLTDELLRLRPTEAAAVMPREARTLARLFPVLLSVPAVSESPEMREDGADARELRMRAAGALRELLARLGDRCRLVLYIDDLHWGDMDSAQIISALLQPPDPPQLLLLLSYRDEESETSPFLRLLFEKENLPSTVDRIDVPLGALSLDEAGEIATEMLGGEAGDAERLARECGGSPYLLNELVVRTRSGVAKGQGVTLDDLLWDTVQGANAECRQLVNLLAVASRPMPVKQLFAAAGLTAIDPSLISVLRTERLTRRSEAGDVDLYHDRIRKTVLKHSPPETIRSLHRSWAEVLEASGNADPESLAIHFEGFGEREKAARNYRTAAGGARKALAFDRAADLYRRSMELWPPEGDGRHELSVNLADALSDAGRGAEAARLYEQAAAEAPQSEVLELQRRAAYQYCTSGYMRKGREAMRAVLRQVQIKLPPSEPLAIVSLLARRAWLRVRGLGFTRREESSIPPEELLRADAAWSASAGLSMVDLTYGTEVQARNLLISLKTGEPYRISRALAREASMTAFIGQSAWARTSRLTAEARRLAEEIQNPHALGLVSMAEGAAEFGRGYFARAAAPLAEAERIFRDECTAVPWELSAARTHILWNKNQLAEFPEVLALSNAMVRAARERGNLLEATNAGIAGPPIALTLSGRSAEAIQYLDDIREEWRDKETTVQSVMADTVRCQIEHHEGRYEETLRRSRSVREEARRNFLLKSQVVRIQLNAVEMFACLGLVVTGRREKANLEGKLRRFIRAHKNEGIPWAAANAECSLAYFAWAGGDDSALRAHLERAVDGYEKSGARLLWAAARRALGKVIGGDAGAEMASACDTWMMQRSITNPELTTRAFFPFTRN